MADSPIAVLHIPHSRRFVPLEQRGSLHLDGDALSAELSRMTDAYTDELFPPTRVEAGRVIFPVSRLVCDVERFPSDDDEPMASRGMGAIYIRTSSGGVLRAQPDAAERRSLLKRWYWPHHSKLERMVHDVRARSGSALIIDCHSFCSTPLPHEPDQTEHRADVCIGTDPFHTPAPVRDALVAALGRQGYSVTIDAPFAGAIVPGRFYRKDHHIFSVMIEVNRRLYMDEASGSKSDDFAQVREAVGTLIETAADATARLSPGPHR